MVFYSNIHFDLKKIIFIEKNYKEIAETLGISEVNARVKMNRIKTRLKTILNP